MATTATEITGVLAYHVDISDENRWVLIDCAPIPGVTWRWILVPANGIGWVTRSYQSTAHLERAVDVVGKAATQIARETDMDSVQIDKTGLQIFLHCRNCEWTSTARTERHGEALARRHAKECPG